MREAVIDEKKASTKDYPKLKSKTSVHWQKAVIVGITEDERRHNKVLRKMYNKFCKGK